MKKPTSLVLPSLVLVVNYFILIRFFINHGSYFAYVEQATLVFFMRDTKPSFYLFI